MPNDLIDTINEAIRTKRELSITVKDGFGKELTLPFQPYIYGEDSLQYQFVWGYMSYTMLFYKFMLDNVISAKLTNVTYTDLPNESYQHSLEEKHYAVLQGFDNFFCGSAMQKKDGEKEK